MANEVTWWYSATFLFSWDVSVKLHTAAFPVASLLIFAGFDGIISRDYIGKMHKLAIVCHLCHSHNHRSLLTNFRKFDC